MRFRELKKKSWMAHFDYFWSEHDDDNYYNVQVFHEYKNGKSKLEAYFEWEYDNGLYCETGTEPFTLTWKDLKYNLKEEGFYIDFYKPKCDKCGGEITFDMFKQQLGYIKIYCDKCFEEEYYLVDEEWLGED